MLGRLRQETVGIRNLGAPVQPVEAVAGRPVAQGHAAQRARLGVVLFRAKFDLAAAQHRLDIGQGPLELGVVVVLGQPA